MVRTPKSEVLLSDAHIAAVNRRRRIIVQDDPSNFDPDDLFGVDFERWIRYRFAYADQPGSQIDGIWWDISFGGNQAVYTSKFLMSVEIPGLQKWRNQGIDFVQRLITASRRRKLEVFWNYRTNPIDAKADGSGLEMNSLNPVKKAHPDWVIRSWWWQGLWNFAVPEARNYRLRILKELAEKYDFDGIQLDFARHVPCLPPGHQWELRNGVTEYVRQARLLLLEIEKRRGRPYLLAARVDDSLRGCHIDGFDVETWAKESLVDIFALGDRSINVDLTGFRRITAGRNIKLQPCLDDHHATDGYRFPPIQFFRGVYGNWWQQGADSVMTFNWSNAPPELARKVGAEPGPISHEQAYHCIGSPETLRFKDKVFVAQRWGGYPWSEGYFNRNEFAPLPAELANEGTPTVLTIAVSDDLELEAERIKEVRLSLVMYGAREGDRFHVKLNGIALGNPVQDFNWKDPQIFAPKPQPPSGGRIHKINPRQRLLKLAFSPQTREFRLGQNQVSVSIAYRIPYLPGFNIHLEKVEVSVEYL